jgi:paired amphipathic helix protein Sin3a
MKNDGHAPVAVSRMTHDDAVDFLDHVREKFSDRPYLYNSFLAVMKEFREQTITTDVVINHVKLLFKGHPELLQGFNLFLPPAYRIGAEAELPRTTAHAEIEDQKAQQFARAFKYVNKVKNRLADAPRTYQEFLTVLNKYQTVHRSVDLVNTEITRLFRSHPDLLSEFAVFLPERSNG